MQSVRKPLYLQIAEATLSRWETGAQIQQRSLDKLLRGFFGIEALRRFLGMPDLAPVTWASSNASGRIDR